MCILIIILGLSSNFENLFFFFFACVSRLRGDKKENYAQAPFPLSRALKNILRNVFQTLFSNRESFSFIYLQPSDISMKFERGFIILLTYFYYFHYFFHLLLPIAETFFASSIYRFINNSDSSFYPSSLSLPHVILSLDQRIYCEEIVPFSHDSGFITHAGIG